MYAMLRTPLLIRRARCSSDSTQATAGVEENDLIRCLQAMLPEGFCRKPPMDSFEDCTPTVSRWPGL